MFTSDYDRIAIVITHQLLLCNKFATELANVQKVCNKVGDVEMIPTLYNNAQPMMLNRKSIRGKQFQQ